MDSLFEGIENEPGMGRGADPPDDDFAGISIDDESNVSEAPPGRDISEVVVHWARSNDARMNDPTTYSVQTPGTSGSPYPVGKAASCLGSLSDADFP